MPPENFQHTLNIFKRLYKKLPPLVPENIKKDMGHALEHMEHNCALGVEELEDTIIVFAKQIWPYRQAFYEFVQLCEGRIGQKFLEAKLSRDLKHRFRIFISEGGTFRDLHSGAAVNFFTPEERVELCHVLVDIQIDVESHTKQEVLSTRRHDYEERVVEFQVILDDIEKRLDTLRKMADNEQEHPQLAAEIREHIRSFEYGLAALGPRPDFDGLCRAEEYFHGRKHYKKIHGHSIPR